MCGCFLRCFPQLYFRMKGAIIGNLCTRTCSSFIRNGYEKASFLESSSMEEISSKNWLIMLSRIKVKMLCNPSLGVKSIANIVFSSISSGVFSFDFFADFTVLSSFFSVFLLAFLLFSLPFLSLFLLFSCDFSSFSIFSIFCSPFLFFDVFLELFLKLP